MTVPQPPRPQPTMFASAVRIFDLSLGQMLWSRRSVFLGVLLGGPVLLAVALRTVEALVRSGFQINGARAGGPALFGMMVWLLYIRFIIPVLGVFYGTSLIADEIDDKTITYLFTRPIPRRAVLLGKYLAYLACTVLLVLPSVMIVFFLVVINMINSFQIFAEPRVLTQGGPGDATRTVVQHLYETAFQNFFQFGSASAMAWALFAVILVFSLLQFRLLRGHTQY